MTKNNTIQKNIILCIVCLYWFSQYVYIPYQTPYLISIGVTASFIGTIVGAYGFSQLLFRLPVGLLADFKGRLKPFIIIGVISVEFASFIRIFFSDGTGFFIANLFSGLASAMWIAFMVLYSNYFEKEDLQKSTGIILATNNLGIFIGFIMSTLLYDKMGIRFLCILAAGASFLAIILSLFIKEPKTPFKNLPLRELVKIYSDKKLITFSIIALLQQGIILSTCMSFTSQAAKLLGASSLQVGICSIIYIITCVLSSYFSATKLAIKLGARLWIPITLAGLMIYCAIVPLLPSVEYIYLAQILAGVSSGILFPFSTSEAMKNVPQEKKSTAMGFYQAVYAIGMTVMPVLTGIISDMFNMHYSFNVLAITAAIGLTGILILNRKQSKTK